MTPPKLPKFLNTVAPILVDNTAITSTAVDTLGFHYARFIFAFGVMDIAMTVVPKVTHCSTSGGTYADITGAAVVTLPVETDDGLLYVIDVALDGTERYLKAAGTMDDGALGNNICVICELYRADITLNTATGAGLDEYIDV